MGRTPLKFSNSSLLVVMRCLFVVVPSIHQASLRLSICLSSHPNVYLSVCLSVCFVWK